MSVASADAEDRALLVLIPGHGHLTSQRFQGGTQLKHSPLSPTYLCLEHCHAGEDSLKSWMRNVENSLQRNNHLKKQTYLNSLEITLKA